MRGDIRVEETARADPVTKKARRRLQGRTDFVLCRPPGPLPLGTLEAKRGELPTEYGLARAPDQHIGHLFSSCT